MLNSENCYSSFYFFNRHRDNSISSHSGKLIAAPNVNEKLWTSELKRNLNANSERTLSKTRLKKNSGPWIGTTITGWWKQSYVKFLIYGGGWKQNYLKFAQSYINYIRSIYYLYYTDNKICLIQWAHFHIIQISGIISNNANCIMLKLPIQIVTSKSWS